MPGCFEGLDAQLPYLQLKAIAQSDMRKTRVGGSADIDFCAGTRGQLLVAGYEVRMQVGLKYVANLKVLLLRHLKVDVHIALWIDHNGFALGSEHVRSVREAIQVELFEVHVKYPVPGNTAGRNSAQMILGRGAPVSLYVDGGQK